MLSSPSGAKIPAWYAATIADFVSAPVVQVLGHLAAASPFDVTPAQRDAWAQEIEIIAATLRATDGWLFLEFDIPRLGTRVDAIVLTGSALIPIEFKIGATEYLRADYNQAWDYALDLKNFHKGSQDAPIFPLLVATDAHDSDSTWIQSSADGVRPPRRCNLAGFERAILEARAEADGATLDGMAWGTAPYRPTPTIIQAARSLYARHSVEAISRNDAGAKNLATTSRTIEQVADAACREQFKAIVFVTGVPGAGKTLVGLNIATRHRRSDDATHTVFLSGNGPLVAVLREALTRDELARRKVSGAKVRKGTVEQEVKPFIQNVHHFRDDGVRTLATGDAPHDRVVIFDEAQRAWDLARTVDFMKRRKRLAGFNRSEPQFLVEYMDRHPDWAVIVCLVGGGQEINTGEAGISTWLDAVREHFPTWRVYISPELFDREYAAGHALDRLTGVAHVEQRSELHLAVSMRSFRSEKVSAFVKALLDLEKGTAKELLSQLGGRYPIAVTRDLSSARKWIRSRARGSEQYGLVASSQAERLKPYAVDVRVNVDPVHWFLGDPTDTRSSWYLEDVATEYQIQGLELDWVCVTWDADLSLSGEAWRHRSFNAKGWQRIHSPERRQYLVNAYRVLLTRARQGMVIFVPPGEASDPTRLPEYYDPTFDYLIELGLPHIA